MSFSAESAYSGWGGTNLLRIRILVLGAVPLDKSTEEIRILIVVIKSKVLDLLYSTFDIYFVARVLFLVLFCRLVLLNSLDERNNTDRIM